MKTSAARDPVTLLSDALEAHQRAWLSAPAESERVASDESARAVARVLESGGEALARWIDERLERPATRTSSDFRAAPASYLADRALDGLVRQNQFLSVSAPAREELVLLYSATLRRLRGLVGRSLEFDALAFEAQRILEREEVELARWREAVPGARTSTRCAEYSVELQLEVLGLRFGDLLEPVLDVGCGEHATLVEALSSRGVEVQGIDRHAAASSRVVRADWLTFQFERERYGTILSHQAFSLHFLHHHLAPGDTAYRYAQAYMRLLQALREGGAFAYAPGLPFMEQHLPRGVYRVERRDLPPAIRGRVHASFRAQGQDVAYACRVERLKVSR